jgi:hypothetical protein
VAYNGTTGVFTVTDNTSGRDGVDQVREVEQLRFADSTVSATSMALESSQRGDLQLALGVYRGLNGAAATPTAYSQVVAALAAGSPASYAATLGAGYASQGGDSFTTTVMANFGITSAALGGATPAASFEALKGALSQIFTLFAPARGQVVLNMTTLLRGLEGDAVFGQVARTWNARVASDFTGLSGTSDLMPEVTTMGVVAPPDFL